MTTDLINKGMFRASGFRNKPIFTGKSLPKNKNRNIGLLVNIGLYGEEEKMSVYSQFPLDKLLWF